MELEHKGITFDKKELSDVLRVGIPSALQMSTVSIANLILQPLINSFGTIVVAAVTAALRIDNIARSPMGAVSNALSSYTAQNIGAGKKERIASGLRVGIVWDFIISALVGMLIFFAGDKMLGFFVTDTNSTDVIAIGMGYLNILAVFFIFQGAMNALNGVFRGIGNVKAFVLSMTVNMACRVIIAYVLVLIFNTGYRGIWVATPVGWIVGFIINCFYYHRDKKNKWEKR
jgi:Na+-driven multidrug efflux pump